MTATAWRHFRRIVAGLAILATVARVLILLVRVAGLVGTVDGVANAVGLGDVVAPYEAAFDALVVQPVLRIVQP